MKNLPNILTIMRLLLAPLFPIVYFSDRVQNGSLLAMGIYILAGFTDVLDGYLARKYNVVTKLGTVLDPLADKFMLICALLTLTIDNLVPVFIVIFVIVKEALMIISGIVLYFRKDQFIIPSNKYGKTATIIFFLGVIETLLFNIPLLNIGLFSIAILIKFTALYTYIRHYLDIHSS